MEKQQENGKTCQPDKTNCDKKTKRRKPLEMKQGNKSTTVADLKVINTLSSVTAIN